MDSEPSRSPRRRRPPRVVVAAVTVAVVVAGGGAAYRATTTSSESGTTRPPSRNTAPPVPVLSGRFGLSARFVDGTQALVPTWLFEVAQEGQPTTSTLARQAVDPRYVVSPPTRAPDPSRSDPAAGFRETDIRSYDVDGTSLTVRFWGSVCSDYSTVAGESGTQVLVRVTGVVKLPGHPCVMLAGELTGSVRLQRPLGDREVVDASDGSTVPRV